VYETFDHTADLGLRARAHDLDTLFADAARGLFSLLVANLDAVWPVEEKTYQVAGDETDYLLRDWLGELLHTFHSERLAFVEFNVCVTRDGLTATCRGEPIDATRHEIDHDVKAITYHGLSVKQTADGWLAEVIADI